MQISHLSRWLTGAALAAAAAGIHTSDALAQATVPRVHVAGLIQANTFECRPDGSSIYTMEARGFDALNVKLCETFTQGGSSMATCDAGLGMRQHEARVTRRSVTASFMTSTYQVLGTVGSPSTRTPWGSPGPTINVPVPANATWCPGGGTIQVQSLGLDIPNAG
jgi:hypothetical protein